MAEERKTLMRRAVRRRTLLGAAIGTATVLLAACGDGGKEPPGGATPTPVPVGMTPTPPAGSASALPSPASPSGSRPASLTTATAIPQSAAPVIDLLRMLAFVPEPVSRWNGVFSFADVATVKQRYGYADIHCIDAAYRIRAG